MARFAGIRSKRARVPHRWKPSTWRLRTTSFVINRTMSSRKPSRRLIRSEEHTSELQSQSNLVCRLLLEKKKEPHANFIPHDPYELIIELKYLGTNLSTPLYLIGQSHKSWYHIVLLASRPNDEKRRYHDC